MQKEKAETITKLLEKLAEEMCDDYCKYAGEDNIDDICSNCPLSVLI